MANTSGDLALEKIAGTDKAKLFPTPFNLNMEDIDKAVTDLKDEKAGSDEIGIVVDGNKTVFPTGAAIGQYIILRNSTISGCTDGLYTAAKAIPFDTVIDSTYLTAVSGGGLNALNSNLTFSTSEQAVGKWINGETLYRKVVYISSLPNDTEGTFAHGITGVAKFTSISGIVDLGTLQVPIPWVPANLTGHNCAITYVDSTNIHIVVDGDRRNVVAYIILEYIK